MSSLFRTPDWILVLPVMLPLAAAGFMMVIPSVRAQKWLNVVATALHLGVAILLLQKVLAQGIQVTQLGNWPAPFGISFVADTLGAAMVGITGLMGFLVAIYALAEVEPEQGKYGFFPLYQVLLMGVSGAFLTGDLFNMFVWFEVMLMSSFVLLSLGARRPQLEGGIKYLVLNFLSSSLFLVALGILYAETGTLNMADMAVTLRQGELSLTVMAAAMLLLVAFGLKAGVFPLFSWLPASYHTPSVTVSAIFAGLLTKVGVYSLIRVFTLIFVGDGDFTHNFIIVISLLTMVTGVLGAAAQFEIRRILSFHIISQIGYMTLGLGFFTEAALTASVFYIIHHIVVKTNLFLMAGAVTHLKGTSELKKIGGLYRFHPWLAVVFLIPAMSLGGVPPLSGFFAKYVLVQEGVHLLAWGSVAVALLVGVLTLYSMTKIWAEGFWKADPRREEAERSGGTVPWPMWAAMLTMAAVTLAISISPEWLLTLAGRAATELMNPDQYIAAVLGGRP
jgi:multicomponent Na+:H+ antiporter subunit D